MITLIATAYHARLSGHRDVDTVVLRLRPTDRAKYRSRCDEAAIVALVEYLLDIRRIEPGET